MQKIKSVKNEAKPGVKGEGAGEPRNYSESLTIKCSKYSRTKKVPYA